jgi:hypothetical protein
MAPAFSVLLIEHTFSAYEKPELVLQQGRLEAETQQACSMDMSMSPFHEQELALSMILRDLHANRESE